MFFFLTIMVPLRSVKPRWNEPTAFPPQPSDKPEITEVTETMLPENPQKYYVSLTYIPICEHVEGILPHLPCSWKSVVEVPLTVGY